MDLTEEEFKRKLKALGVPVWSMASFRELTEGFASASLGSGFYGDVELLSDARRSFVLKRMKDPFGEDFFREVEALAKVRGIEGVQQVEAIVAEDEQCAIVSLYAGASISTCIEENLLTGE